MGTPLRTPALSTSCRTATSMKAPTDHPEIEVRFFHTKSVLLRTLDGDSSSTRQREYSSWLAQAERVLVCCG